MAITESNTGTTTPTVGTTWSDLVANSTADGVYQVWVDCAAMVIGDAMELRVNEKVISAGTARTAFISGLSNAQGQAALVSPALVLMHGWTVSIRQTTGTARAFPWSIRQIA